MMATPIYDFSVKVSNRLKDRSGASIVIALIFFLICAVVGSVVLTAASINAKAVATHQETQQADYTVSSAAQLVAGQLASDKVAVWVYADGEAAPNDISPKDGSLPTLLTNILSQGNVKDLWEARKSGQDYYVGGQTGAPLTITAGNGIPVVYAKIKFDRNLNITVQLSQNSLMAADSPYNETITIPCIPYYNNEGKMFQCKWESATIGKTSTATTSGGGGTP